MHRQRPIPLPVRTYASSWWVMTYVFPGQQSPVAAFQAGDPTSNGGAAPGPPALPRRWGKARPGSSPRPAGRALTQNPGTSRARSAGPSIRLLSVALGCPDAGQLAAFYARVTGGKVIFRDNRWAVVQAPGAPRLTPWLTPQCPTEGGETGVNAGKSGETPTDEPRMRTVIRSLVPWLGTLTP